MKPPPSRFWLFLLLAPISTLLTADLHASSVDSVFYREKIKPVFTKNCLGCHNASVSQGGLDITNRESLLKGGESGPAIQAGNSEASTLYKLINHSEQPGMPFKGKKLSDETIALIAEWINGGAPYDESSLVSKAKGEEKPIEVSHWAFKVPVRPDLPVLGDKKRKFKNPIDLFLEARRTELKLQASAEADKKVLLRRVYLDLIGLAPTPEETETFLKDKSPDAYEKVVDQLLAKEDHGIRWGRHWLDIWRYSDWYGYRKTNQVRYSQPHIWRWRDWTVKAVNQNKPYNQMIIDMLAGDEVAPDDPEHLAATGYLVRSWYLFNRNVWLQDAAEYTATAFMGLTMKCARCHTHKYDPIQHTEYYRFRAFFEPYDVRTDRVEGQADVLKDGIVRAYDGDVTAQTYRFIRGNEATPEKDKPLTPAVPAFFNSKIDIKPISLPMDLRYPDGREFVQRDVVAQAEAEIQTAKEKLENANAEYKKASAPVQLSSGEWKADENAVKKARNDVTSAEKHLAYVEANLPAIQARIAADRAAFQEIVPANAEELSDESRKLERKANFLKADEQLFLANLEMDEARGNDKKVGAAKVKLEAAAKVLNEPAEGYTSIGKLYPSTSSGRRLALAKWIASQDNPLTARVAVNHIWLRHFGRPLVPTVFNFGMSGKSPSHPELLDWLAMEFMESGWDMKHLHRLMVTSAAYRMTSSIENDNPNIKSDPDNIYLWRMNTRRKEAEVVRDSLLNIAGRLDRAMGGPEIDETKSESVLRRSIYFRHTPDLQVEMLQVFDLANPNECFERTESVMPQQALAMSNSGLSYSMSRVIAGEMKDLQDDAFINQSFEKMLGRTASALELKESHQFLHQQMSLYQDLTKLTPFTSKEMPSVKASTDPKQRARESLVHVLINHNDFVTVR